MKLIFYMLMIFALCSSCTRAETSLSSNAGQKFIQTFAQVAHKDYGLDAWMEGGEFRQSVNEFTLYFISQETLGKDQARRLFLSTMDRLVNMINSDEQLRPYLSHYPFTHKDVVLIISFFKNGDVRYRQNLPYIAMVTSFGDTIAYITQADSASLSESTKESISHARELVNCPN